MAWHDLPHASSRRPSIARSGTKGIGAAGLGLLLVILLGTAELVTGAIPIPSMELLSKINEVRTASSDVALAPEPTLTAWLDLLVTSVTSYEDLTAERILDHLREHTIENVAYASVGVFRAESRQRLFEEMFAWRESRRPELTHAALAGVQDNSEKPFHSWVILVERLPLFDPALLRNNSGRFHHRCALCGHGYNGQFQGGDRLLLLRCPACRSTYDILALNTMGRYVRPNQFLSGVHPPTAFPDAKGQKEELKALWRSVVAHCHYLTDSDETTEAAVPKDSWQTAHQTFRNRSGDCEDTSILLADWLISRGISARVAIGATEELAGHAWCVARVGEEEFVLETTFNSRDASSLTTVSESVETYFPDYQFDREHLYVRKNEPHEWAKSYWSTDDWVAIPYTETPKSESVCSNRPAAPWLPPLSSTRMEENLVTAKDS